MINNKLIEHNQNPNAHKTLFDAVRTETDQKIAQHNSKISAHPKLRLFTFFMGD